eukprot:4057997-Pleurochrysis_carterae.AAC.1
MHGHACRDAQARLPSCACTFADLRMPQVLNPYSESAIAQKERQMRELAIINGTLKEEDLAANAANWSNAAAKGALWRAPPPPVSAPNCGGTMDDEYASFMAELSGGGPAPPG